MHEEELLHGICHYLALALAEKYNYKIILWLDYDLEIEKDVLIHAFNITNEGKFIDYNGITNNIENIIGEFDYNEKPVICGLTIEKTKLILNRLEISYNNQETIKFVNKYIKNLFL